MSRKDYRESLDALESAVCEMGDLVLERFDDSLRAAEHRDRELARSVVHGDDDINEIYLALESECIDLLALQQPVASDLRFIAGSFKIITDVERIGDLATNLAGYTLAAEGSEIDSIDPYGIGRDARDLVADALAAYAAADAEACYEIAERDDAIDASCRSASDRIVRDLIEREATDDDPWSVERLTDDISRLLLTIRDLERVADHGVNIAARTLYTVESDSELIY